MGGLITNDQHASAMLVRLLGMSFEKGEAEEEELIMPLHLRDGLGPKNELLKRTRRRRRNLTLEVLVPSQDDSALRQASLMYSLQTMLSIGGLYQVREVKEQGEGKGDEATEHEENKEPLVSDKIDSRTMPYVGRVVPTV